MELICISSQGLIRIRVIGMVAGGRRRKVCVWSLLNNPGHCPAPPKATQLPSPALTPRSLPSHCHQSGTNQVLQSKRENPAIERKCSPTSWAKPTAPSGILSQTISRGDKQVWMASGFKCKKSQNTQTIQCQNFFLKMQSLREGRDYCCLLSPPALHLPSKSPSIPGTSP